MDERSPFPEKDVYPYYTLQRPVPGPPGVGVFSGFTQETVRMVHFHRKITPILAGALRPALLLLLIWLLAIFAATVSAHLIGRLALTDRAEAISPGRENDR